MRAIGYLTEYGPSQSNGAALSAQNDEFLRFCLQRHDPLT